MAAGRLNLYTLSYSSSSGEIFLSNSSPRIVRVFARTDFYSRVQFPTTSQRIRYRCLKFPRWGFRDEKAVVGQMENSVNNLQTPFEFLLSIFPGGSWWSLPAYEEKSSAENEVTVRDALKLMWGYLGKEQWIVVAALGALIIAAIAEITMPRVLAASIFSAQHGDKTLFYSKAHFLLVLCFTSGVSSGLRSALFATANVILVKRLRKALYSALISQDMVFFDREEVGSLTSRLGADCQQLSNVLGNNIHLIGRNALQGLGALINLLMLSWPLALSSIITCLALAAIFLLYGRYQKLAAKLTQDLTASASEAAEETLSSIRTIRVYGTENEELGRYKHWLERLSSLSLRESVAYGFWNMSFSILFRSTQVFALLLGGMAIMTGHVSTEDLTKYVLYCEWLIYATWRIVDNIISLFRAVGSSERVFQLMKLPCSDQVLSKGVRLQRLDGKTEFVNVSFRYPSRPTIPILENFNLSMKANEVIALVGPSGSGKTTLVNLLLRLYEPSNGEVHTFASVQLLSQEIIEACKSGVMWKTTVILIAHRLSTVKSADRIIVMDGGRIVEMGRHKELVQKRGLYYRLVKLQSSFIS